MNQSKEHLNTSQHGRQSLSSQFDRPNSPPTGHYLKQNQLANSTALLVPKAADMPTQMTRFIQKKPSSNHKLNNSAGNLYSARNKLAQSQLQNSTLNESSNLNSLLNSHFKAKGQMMPASLLGSSAANTGIATAKLLEKIKATKAMPAQQSGSKPRQTAPTASRPIDLEALASTSNNLTLSSVSAGMTGFNLAAPDHSTRPIPIHSALNLNSKGKHTASGALDTKPPVQLSKAASGIGSKSSANDAQKGQFNISLSNAKNVSVYEINNYFGGATPGDNQANRHSRADKKDPTNFNHLVHRQSSPKHAEITELYGIQPGYNAGLREKQVGASSMTPTGMASHQSGKPVGKLAFQLADASKSRLSGGVNTMSKESMNESGPPGVHRIPQETRSSLHGDKSLGSGMNLLQHGISGHPLTSMLAKSGLIPASPKPGLATGSKAKIPTYLG